MVKKSLNDIQKKEIGEAIQRLESKSSIEIAVAVVPHSGKKFLLLKMLRWGLFLQNLSIIIFTLWYFDISHWTTLEKLNGLLCLFFGFFLLILSFIPKIVGTIEENVLKHAMAMFTKQRIYQTKDHTGLLVYLSLLEKKVFILADIGINKKTAETYWKERANRIAVKMKQKDLTAAIVNCISQIEKDLAPSFPKNSNDKNEVDDSIIES